MHICQRFSVDLAQHFVGRWCFFDAVVPRQSGNWLGQRAAVFRIHLTQLQEQARHDFQIRLGFAGWVDRLFLPRNDAAGVGKAACLFGKAACGQAEYFSLNFLAWPPGLLFGDRELLCQVLLKLINWLFRELL